MAADFSQREEGEKVSKEALRIVLHQTSANYRKPETFENKMTYPLPPYSTVIGALHKACGYTETHDMDISIQGRYGSMNREVYRDYNFLNSTFDDRGILVKMANESMLSNAFVKVAESKKQRSSFKNNFCINVLNQELLSEYQELKRKSQELQEQKEKSIKPELDKLKRERTELAKLRKALDKSDSRYKEMSIQEKLIKEKEKKVSEDFKRFEEENYSKPFSRFRTITTSVKSYEVLFDIDLIIHVVSDKQTMDDIYNHIYDLKALGRSEDFVDVIEIKRVKLTDTDEECECKHKYSAYISLENVRKKRVFTRTKSVDVPIIGTKYLLPKIYRIDSSSKKRVFDEKKVVYASNFWIGETCEEAGILLDKKADNDYYIVNLV